MQKFTMDGINKLFICKSGVVEFDVQIDLYSDWKEELLIGDNLKYEQALRTVGGDPISDVRNLGDTYFLINDWKIRPYEADHRLLVDGNLFTEDGSSAVVSTTGDYNVLVEMQTSNLVDSTVAQLDITNLQYLIESQRDLNRGYGSIFYVDPVNGDNTANNGLAPDNAFKTISASINACVAGQGDVIFVIHNEVGTTYLSEDIVINKAGISLRGPGPSVVIDCQTSSNTITVGAPEITIDGFTLKNTRTSNSVEVNGEKCLIQNCLFETGNYHAIKVNTGGESVIRNNHFHYDAGGIEVEGYGASAPHGVIIENNVLHDFRKYGIHIKGDVDDVKIVNNKIYSNPTGICIGSGVTHTTISEDNIIADNTLVNICNSGTNTINELVRRPEEYVQIMKDTIYTHSQGTVGKTFEDTLTEILSMANGKIVNSSSGVFDFYDQDNTSVIFTLTESGTQRLRS